MRLDQQRLSRREGVDRRRGPGGAWLQGHIRPDAVVCELDEGGSRQEGWRGPAGSFNHGSRSAPVDSRSRVYTWKRTLAMKKTTLTILAAAIVAAAAVTIAPLSAHHSHAMFDGSKETEITGVLTSVRFANPHVYLRIEATHRDGQPLEPKQTWAI